MKWLKVKYLIRLFERIYLEEQLDNNSPQTVSVTLFSEILLVTFALEMIQGAIKSFKCVWGCVCMWVCM